MEALSRVTENSSPIYWASWFIMLLLIAVETAPVFVKLISMKGPYDNLLKAEEFRFETEETYEVAKASGSVRTRSSELPSAETKFAHERLDNALKKA
jgi:hypothetical protein